MEFIINYTSDTSDTEDNTDHTVNNTNSNNINEPIIEYFACNKITGISDELISDLSIFAISSIMGGSSGLTGKENQDKYCFQIIKRVKNNGFSMTVDNITVIMVCDGHGKYGKIYADTIIENFFDVIIQHLHKIIENPNDHVLLKSLFVNFNNDVFYQSYGHLNGGSTCTLIIDTNDFTICANIGDCDAHIIYEGSDKPTLLSQNQSLMNVNEVKRLYNIGSHINIRYHMRPFNQLTDKPEDRFADEQLVWKRDSDNALTFNSPSNQPRLYFNTAKKDFAMYVHNDKNGVMSNCPRSFGDFQNEYVTAEPDVNVIYHPVGLNKNIPHKIITGSDGFFNCYTNEEFEQLCLLNPNEIINHGLKQVDKTFGKKHADNTTIIVFDSSIN